MNSAALVRLILAATICLSFLQAQDETVISDSPDNASTRYRIEGRVLNDLTGAPVGGAKVRLEVVRAHVSCMNCDPPAAIPLEPELAREVVTSRDGSFVFGNVPATNVSITATKPGYLVGPHFRRHADDPLGVYFISDKTVPITLQLTALASISGVLRDHKGMLITKNANVTLWCLRSWAGWPRLEYCNSADFDTNGNYQFRDLQPGHYYLVADPPVNGGHEPARDAKGRAVGEVPVSHPAPSAEHPNPFFTLHEAENARIDFRLPQKMLHHMSATVTTCQSCAYDIVDQNGSKAYLFNPPFFGERLEAWLPNGSYRLETWGTDLSGPSSFEIEDSDLSDLSFSISASQRIEIPVEISSLGPSVPNCPNEVPVCGFVAVNLVRFLPGGYVEVVCSTNHAGRFDGLPLQHSDAASVIPGTYTVTVAPTFNVYAKSVMSGTIDLSTETLVVRPGDVPKPIQIVLAEGAIVEGLVQRNGQPSRAWVYAIAEDIDPKTDFREFQPVTSEPDGEFRIQGLAPGSYLLFASDIELPLNVHDPAEVDYWRSRGKVIHLAAGKTAKLALTVADAPEVP
jgi:hypothetical protein